MAYQPKPAGPKNLRELFHWIWAELKTIAVDQGQQDVDLSDHLADLNNPHQVMHAQLTDVSPDDHHPQFHDLTSHTDVDLINLDPGDGLFFNGGLWINRAPYEESWPTGLGNGGELNIGPGINDIEVIAGLGAISDTYTNPLAPPVVTGITWNQINQAITAAPSVAGSIVWFSIFNTGVPAGSIGNIPLFAGDLHQWATPPSPTLARQEIFLGVALHNGTTWNEISNPKVINQAAETLRELVTAVLPITTIIQGGDTHEEALFALSQDAGTVWENNRNWHVDKSDPNREALPAANPITFKYVDRTFTSVGAFTTAVDPSQYDAGAGPVPVPGPANSCTIQRLYLDPANNYWMLWGQFVYSNFLTAQANLAADSANTTVPFILQNSILLGYAIVEQAKSDWDPDEAVWTPAGSDSGGVGGGGTPITDHDNLNGITPDNHHNQVHLLYGTDHSDVDPAVPLELTQILEWSEVGDDKFRGDYRNTYIASYTEGPTYYPQQWADNPSWLSICNTETTDPAFPINVGEPQKTYPVEPPFLINNFVGQVRTGHVYTFVESGEIRSTYIWVPEVSGSTRYSFVTILDPNGSSPISNRVDIDASTLTPNAWNVVALGTLVVGPGTEILGFLESQNFGSATQVTGGWRFDGITNVNPPATSGWNRDNNHSIVRIDKTDLDTVDRSAELSGIVVGSTIQFVETASPGNFVDYITLAAPVDQGTYYEYSVSLTAQGGTISDADVCTMTADIPVAQATQYSYETDKWLVEPAWVSIESFLEHDGVPQAVSADIGYGIDLEFQQLAQSPDWDLIPIGGGSGGGSSFIPDTFTGAGTTGYVPDPGTEQNFFLRDDGSWQAGASPVTFSVSQPTHGLSLLDAVHNNGTTYEGAIATDINKTAHGIVTEVIDVDNIVVSMTGQYTVLAHGLSIGQFYYVGVVAGTIQLTEPDLSVPGTFSQPVLFVVDVNTIQVLSHRPMTAGPDVDSVAWGNITGTISNQNDLQAELNALQSQLDEIPSISSARIVLNQTVNPVTDHASGLITNIVMDTGTGKVSVTLTGASAVENLSITASAENTVLPQTALQGVNARIAAINLAEVIVYNTNNTAIDNNVQINIQIMDIG